MMRLSTCWASREERRGSLAADSIMRVSVTAVTGAIGIDAPPETMWSRRAQMRPVWPGWYMCDPSSVP